MNRYLLFIGADYYPQGGAYDFLHAYPTLEAAKEAFDTSRGRSIPGSWAHVARIEDDGELVVLELRQSGRNKKWLKD